MSVNSKRQLDDTQERARTNKRFNYLLSCVPKKKIITTEYLTRLNASPFFVVVIYVGLTVGQFTELRKPGWPRPGASCMWSGIRSSGSP